MLDIHNFSCLKVTSFKSTLRSFFSQYCIDLLLISFSFHFPEVFYFIAAYANLFKELLGKYHHCIYVFMQSFIFWVDKFGRYYDDVHINSFIFFLRYFPLMIVSGGNTCQVAIYVCRKIMGRKRIFAFKPVQIQLNGLYHEIYFPKI